MRRKSSSPYLTQSGSCQDQDVVTPTCVARTRATTVPVQCLLTRLRLPGAHAATAAVRAYVCYSCHDHQGFQEQARAGAQFSGKGLGEWGLDTLTRADERERGVQVFALESFDASPRAHPFLRRSFPSPFLFSFSPLFLSVSSREHLPSKHRHLSAAAGISFNYRRRVQIHMRRRREARERTTGCAAESCCADCSFETLAPTLTPSPLFSCCCPSTCTNPNPLPIALRRLALRCVEHMFRCVSRMPACVSAADVEQGQISLEEVGICLKDMYPTVPC